MKVKEHGFLFGVEVTCDRCGAVIILEGINDVKQRCIDSEEVACFTCPECNHVSEVFKRYKPKPLNPDIEKILAECVGVHRFPGP